MRLLLPLCCICVLVAAERPIAPALAIGLNAITSYGDAWQFTDMMRYGREWISRTDAKAWTVVEDAQGWPVSLKHADGRTAEISPAHPIFMYFYGRHVQGEVTLTWEGDGEVAVAGRTVKEVVATAPTPRRKVYAWDYTAGDPTIEVTRSNPADHVRDIHLWMPGLADSTQTFHPEWTALLAPYPYLRFMDWRRTNNSTESAWSDRKRPEDMRQSGAIAWEYIAQLCNETGKDAWICIPHLATDDYVRQLARLFKARLDPRLRLYVEYSNEIWNHSFAQTHWLYQQAQDEITAKGLKDAAGAPLAKWTYAVDLCGRRSAQIWEIMARELGDPERIVRTITHWKWLERAMAAALDPAHGEGRVDLIGLNGYFISGHAFDYCRREAATWDIDEAFDVLSQLVLLDDAPAWREEIAKVRAQWPRIPITCYEGGQHFANPFTADAQGDVITKLMIAVNGDRRMRGLYASALESWHLAGADGFTAFLDVGPWSKYGCWGHKEYVRQPLDDVRDASGTVIERGAHKWAALLDYAARSQRRRPTAGLAISPTVLPEAVPGQPYEARLAASGGTPPYAWKLLGGRLPHGLSLAADGTIAGTPAASEQLAFLVDCTDSAGVPVARPLALFMPPVAPAAWRTLDPAQLSPVHGVPACTDSAAASLAQGYAVQAAITPAKAPGAHQTLGFAINLTPDGDKDDYLTLGIRDGNVTVHSRFLKGSRGEIWPPRTFAITPDSGETSSKSAWDAGEAWTITATTRPGSGTGAIDLILEVRDQDGQPRLAGGRADVAQGRLLLRELAVKDVLRSGPWGLLAGDAAVSALRWAPLP